LKNTPFGPGTLNPFPQGVGKICLKFRVLRGFGGKSLYTGGGLTPGAKRGRVFKWGGL